MRDAKQEFVKRNGTSHRTSVGRFLALGAAISLLGQSTLHAAPSVIGAVDQIDRSEGTFSVLGQTFPLARIRVVDDHPLATGALVWVDIHASGKNLPSYAVYVLPEDYIEGSTELFVSGRVTALTNTGRLRVGALNVDFNAALSNGSIELFLGDLVELYGVQPVRNGLFLADTLKVVVKGSLPQHAAVRGVGGSGLAGVGGSGLLGVGGSGTLGVGGSGLLGVGGSGLLGVGGSSLLGVDGSDLLGVDGSDLLGVGGSGLLGVGGSGTLGVGGSGLLGVGGSGTLGVGGSGLLGVGGSGTLGVGGSGAQ